MKRNDTKNVAGFIFLFCDGLGILEESLAERFGELMRDRETALEVGTSSLFTLVFASSIYFSVKLSGSCWWNCLEAAQRARDVGIYMWQ